MIKEIKALPAAKGTEYLLLPGEIELKEQKKRESEGFALDVEVVEELMRLGKTYDVKWIE